MPATNPTTITLIAFLPLIAWRMYTRFKRLVGRQRLGRIRPWIQLVIFPLVLALLAVVAREHLVRLWWMAGGLALGGMLGVFGLSKTKFEPTPEGLFYTPNAHLGIALSSLFVLRILYRFVEVFWLHPPAGPQQPDDFTKSPLTLLVIGLMAGYFIVYAAGLIRWRFRMLRARRMREAAKAQDPPA